MRHCNRPTLHFKNSNWFVPAKECNVNYLSIDTPLLIKLSQTQFRKKPSIFRMSKLERKTNTSSMELVLWNYVEKNAIFIVIEHSKCLTNFSPSQFPWPCSLQSFLAISVVSWCENGNSHSHDTIFNQINSFHIKQSPAVSNHGPKTRKKKNLFLFGFLQSLVLKL